MLIDATESPTDATPLAARRRLNPATITGIQRRRRLQAEAERLQFMRRIQLAQSQTCINVDESVGSATLGA
ncbi:MAG: hypothetical protein ACYDCQ_01020 [Dehalococcoidia bacterium]